MGIITPKAGNLINNNKDIIFMIIMLFMVLYFYNLQKYATKNISRDKLPLCTLEYNCKAGRKQAIVFDLSLKAKSFDVINKLHSDVRIGGFWQPPHCTRKQPHQIAIIVPLNDEKEQLPIFIENLIGFLKRQKREFKIFVVEHKGPEPYNQDALYNIGFVESKLHGNFSCVIFHDINKVPVNLCNSYDCYAHSVKQLSTTDSDDLTTVSAFSVKTFKEMNGFANTQYGLGNKDTGIQKRLKSAKITIESDASVGKYQDISKRKNQKGSVERSPDLDDLSKFRENDGLKNLKYTVHTVKKEYLFTRIVASYPAPEKKIEVTATKDNPI